MLNLKILLLIKNKKWFTVNKDNLTIFVERLKKIGIEIRLVSSCPWVYIDKINGKKVMETFEGNHGFTVCFLPLKDNQEIKFTDIGEIFKLIRKYVK